MRVVIDMQGAQSESRFRGIGRYSLEFAKSVARSRSHNEVVLALNGALPDSIGSIREEFAGLLPPECIRVWSSPSATAFNNLSQAASRQIAMEIRARFLISLNPDIIHITSLFEGYLDDAITDTAVTNSLTPISCHCYDLIPMLNPEIFLNPSPSYKEFYESKLSMLQKASLILTISESAKGEIEAFNDASGVKIPVKNVSAGIGEQFFHGNSADQTEGREYTKLNINSPFLLYVGGADPTKNLDRLVSAFAALPEKYLKTHRLVLAGRMPPASSEHLRRLGGKLALKNEQLQLLGHVSDNELLHLYHNCQLFICPSTHEGFGLPPLEAMACGAPVIASNRSSLPEVIGNTEALFDPYDETEICSKILEVLENQDFSFSLSEKGPGQARKYSWDLVGESAWRAWTDFLSDRSGESRLLDLRTRQAHSTIETIADLLKDHEADDSNVTEIAAHIAQNQAQSPQRQLFVDVSELQRHDAGTGVQRVVRGYLSNLIKNSPQDFVVEPVYASMEHGYRYATRFKQTFIEASEIAFEVDADLQWQRGDIFLVLDSQHHVQISQKHFYRQLQSDGVIVKFIVYDLLPIQYPDLFFDPELSNLHAQWLAMCAQSDGAICISQATATSLQHWIITNSIETSAYFHIESNHIGCDLEGSQPSVGRPDNADALLERIRALPSFLCVSTIEPRKQQGFILEAIEQLWGNGKNVNLVFVGRAGWKTDELSSYIRKHQEIDFRLFWLEGISDEFLAEVYRACSCVVAASLNEGFGLSLVEAAKFEKPIIARDIPVFREIAEESAQFFDSSTPQEFAEVLAEWLTRFEAGSHICSTDLKVISWQQSTENLQRKLVSANNPKKQLMVDVSELVQRDAATGIQRVVKNICAEWLSHPPAGYRVELVYATGDEGYKYAKAFASTFSQHDLSPASDDFIDFTQGDIFFGLDLQPSLQVQHRDQISKMRRFGVIAKFMVYDLLPVSMPQFFPKGTEHGMSDWLEVTANSDGVICISQATCADYMDWLCARVPERTNEFTVDYAYLGSDFSGSNESDGYDHPKRIIHEESPNRLRFLMVGTIEPRKGHAEVLDAFDLAWREGLDLSLAFVGKKGWLCDNLERRILGHAELNDRLEWFSNASDSVLEGIYQGSHCLIAASYGEGFGLPIVEAAKIGLPIIARDIPVFKETIADGGHYFAGDTNKTLYRSLLEWVALYQSNQHPKSNTIQTRSWKRCASEIFDRLR